MQRLEAEWWTKWKIEADEYMDVFISKYGVQTKRKKVTAVNRKLNKKLLSFFNSDFQFFAVAFIVSLILFWFYHLLSDWCCFCLFIRFFPFFLLSFRLIFSPSFFYISGWFLLDLNWHSFSANFSNWFFLSKCPRNFPYLHSLQYFEFIFPTLSIYSFTFAHTQIFVSIFPYGRFHLPTLRRFFVSIFTHSACIRFHFSFFFLTFSRYSFPFPFPLKIFFSIFPPADDFLFHFPTGRGFSFPFSHRQMIFFYIFPLSADFRFLFATITRSTNFCRCPFPFSPPSSNSLFCFPTLSRYLFPFSRSQQIFDSIFPLFAFIRFQFHFHVPLSTYIRFHFPSLSEFSFPFCHYYQIYVSISSLSGYVRFHFATLQEISFSIFPPSVVVRSILPPSATFHFHFISFSFHPLLFPVSIGFTLCLSMIMLRQW